MQKWTLRTLAVLTCGLTVGRCGLVNELKETNHAIQRTAKALEDDALSRTQTQDTLTDLLGQMSPYLVAIVAAGAALLYLRLRRERGKRKEAEKRANGSAPSSETAK